MSGPSDLERTGVQCTGRMMNLRAGLVVHHRPVIKGRLGRCRTGGDPGLAEQDARVCIRSRTLGWHRERIRTVPSRERISLIQPADAIFESARSKDVRLTVSQSHALWFRENAGQFGSERMPDTAEQLRERTSGEDREDDHAGT